MSKRNNRRIAGPRPAAVVVDHGWDDSPHDAPPDGNSPWARRRRAEIVRMKATGPAAPTGEKGRLTGIIKSGGGSVLVPADFDYLEVMQPPTRWATIKKMMADDAVKALYHAMTLPIRSVDLIVEAGTDDELGNKMADLVRSDLDGMTVSLQRHRMEAIRFVADGVRVFEKVFEVREDGLVHLRKLGLRPNPSIIQWLTDDNGGPRGVTQLDSEGNEVTLGIDRLLIFTHEGEGANMTGESAFRSAYKPWWYKDKLEHIAAIAAERGAVGIPVGTVSSVDDDDEDTVMAAAETILQGVRAHDSGYVVESDVFKFRVAGRDGAVIDCEPGIARCTRGIWVQGLADFLALGSPGAAGSWALGKDKTSLLLMVLKAVIMTMDDTYNRHLIPLWMRWNFGDVPAESLPRISHGPLDTRNVAEWFTAIGSAVTSGLVPADDQVQAMAREMLGVPELPEVEADPDADPNAAAAPADETADPATTLNGAQITSLVGLIQSMGDGPGQLPQEVVIQIIITAFALPRKRVEEILGIQPADNLEDPGATSPVPATTADERAAQQPNEAGDDPAAAPGVAVQQAAGPPRLESLIKIEALGIKVRFAEMEGALDRGEGRMVARLAKLQEKAAKILAAKGAKIVKTEGWEALAGISLPAEEEADVMLEELSDLYAMGVEEYGRELSSQGAKPEPVEDKGPSKALIAAFAIFAGKRLADRMLNAFGAEVMRGARSGFNPATVAKSIAEGGAKLLADLARQGASMAMGAGRADANKANIDKAPTELYSTMLDANVCGPCSESEGQLIEWDEGPPVPNPFCEGGSRCRCIRVPVVDKEAK